MNEEVKVRPEEIPDYAWQQGFRVLAKSIQRALADPKIRAEYEAWKASQAAQEVRA